MTPAQLDHLRAIDAHLAKLLDIAAKRTPGEWINGGRYDLDYVHNRDEAFCTMNTHNAAFIASCAGNAEAGWKATRAAIAGLMDFEELDPHLQVMVESAQATSILKSILAAFPSI